MLLGDSGQEFAKTWIAAWNAHDVDAILGHYAQHVVYASPLIARLPGVVSGRLNGIHKVRDLCVRALARYPNLHFDLLQVFGGVDSLVVYFRSVNGLEAAETFTLDDSGRATHVYCHYAGS